MSIETARLDQHPGIVIHPSSMGTTLSDNRFKNFATDIRQAIVSTIVTIGQLRVLNTELVQDGCVNVVNVNPIDDRLVTEFV